MQAYETVTVRCTQCGAVLEQHTNVEPGAELPEPSPCDRCGAPESACCLQLRDTHGGVDMRLTQPWERPAGEGTPIDWPPPPIASVGIEADSRCVCGHHPLEHDLRTRLLEGGPARCKKCDCADCVLRPGSPGPIAVYDDEGCPIDDGRQDKA